VTRSKLAKTTEVTTTTTALPSKLGNQVGPTRKRAALGDVTNAHKKLASVDIKTEKPAVKRPLSRKPSVNVVKESKTVVKQETKPLAQKTTTTSASVVIPKKRPSETVAPRRSQLTQSTSSTSLTQKTRVASRPRAEEPEQEAPRKKQKLEQKPDWDDLDATDANDPLMVSEYVNDIFDYMRELEVCPFHVNTNGRSKPCQIQIT